jgi:hypothetical protein
MVFSSLWRLCGFVAITLFEKTKPIRQEGIAGQVLRWAIWD